MAWLWCFGLALAVLLCCWFTASVVLKDNKDKKDKKKKKKDKKKNEDPLGSSCS
jgi:uncharacterized membrane protein YciS (DUF1049 family)